MLAEPRAAIIRQTLDDHFLGNDARVSTPEPIWWWNSVHALGSIAKLGWTYPTPGDGVLVVPYCPEIIDAQTIGMTEEELVEYVGVIQWVVDTHMLTWTDWADSEDRHAIVDAQLKETWPDQHRLLHEMLDRHD